MAQEGDRLSQYITDLIHTRDVLDGLMATGQAHREEAYGQQDQMIVSRSPIP